jgi:large subunit ribosomal protein L7/L12
MSEKSEKIIKILRELETLELIEASKLILKIEEIFGVDSNINNIQSIPTPLVPVIEKIEIEQEKTEFDVILTKIPTDKKIAVLKIIRSLTGLGLKEAKELVDTVPKVVKGSVNKDEAEKIKKELSEVGAEVILD